jgi:Neugrin
MHAPLFDASDPETPAKPDWAVRKDAIRTSLGGKAWNPSQKLSPDTMAAIRTLNAQYPEQFTPSVLAKHFDVSFEAMRRILKSKWRPSEVEEDGRRNRWEKRGERAWTSLADEGHKPPRKWREKGVGTVRQGVDLDGVERWKRSEWWRRKTWWEREVVESVLGGKGGERVAKNDILV